MPAGIGYGLASRRRKGAFNMKQRPMAAGSAAMKEEFEAKAAPRRAFQSVQKRRAAKRKA